MLFCFISTQKSFFRNSTRVTDRRTDGRTDGHSLINARTHGNESMINNHDLCLGINGAGWTKPIKSGIIAAFPAPSVRWGKRLMVIHTIPAERAKMREEVGAFPHKNVSCGGGWWIANQRPCDNF